ncbi:Xaa-Pro peptidase family protein [Desulfosarcina sp. OttesenSCG-928-A07]|nr:Xaa-Pro peptidase family protein [Desulfosarcina sp. OttesenSCG-928-G17]MDL2328674.1 Xaa-Pro peptidase family protein [Desulfosarcina sp. OttesenSCG-928-A07]
MDLPISTPLSEITPRIAHLQASLNQMGLDGAMILQNTDLFYFSGTIQQGHLYIPAEGEPVFMVHKNFERARMESPLGTLIKLDSPKSVMDLIQKNGLKPPTIMGMELDVMPASTYFYYKKIFPHVEIQDISGPIRKIRAIKSAYEVDLIRKAAALSDEVTEMMPSLLKVGMTEVDLAGRVEAEARRRGHQGLVRMRMWGAEMFYGHLMAGPSAAVPSCIPSPTGGPSVSPAVAQGPGFRKIQPGDLVLLDYVFAWKGYLADSTRIFSLGEPSPEMVAAHTAILEMQARLKPMGKPGALAGDLYQEAMAFASQRGISENFMGAGENRVRFIGHGVGLELDELPVIAQGQRMALEAGMTIALEPKMIFPDVGVVGIENTHLVTPDGFEQLTHAEESIVCVPAG